MAASDAKPLPIYGVAHRVTVPIFNITTGEVLTGGLAGLAATVSLDGAAFASTGLTVAEIGTTGFVTVDIDATRMTANTVALKVTSSTSNSSDAVEIIYPSAYYLPATDATNKAVLIQDGTGTGQIDTASGKVRLAPDGMQGMTPVTADPSGRATTIDGMIVQLWCAENNLHTTTSSGGVVTERVYAADGTTTLLSGTVTQTDVNTASKGKMT